MLCCLRHGIITRYLYVPLRVGHGPCLCCYYLQFQTDRCLAGNASISMLAQAGQMGCAQNVFDKLVHRKQASWGSLIIGYVNTGEYHQALSIYQKMQKDDSVSTCYYMFGALLKACIGLNYFQRGQEIHADIARLGISENCGNPLVNLYAKFGLVELAREVFDMIANRNIVLWNILITGYVAYGFSEEALDCLEKMEKDGFSPNNVTLICCLKGCAALRAKLKGQEIHVEVARCCLLGNDLQVCCALLNMYIKCDCLENASEVFDKLPARDVVVWNVLIGGYSEKGLEQEALSCFQRMQYEGISPDSTTAASILKACGIVGDISMGRKVHDDIIAKGYIEHDIFIGSTLVDMYVKCKCIIEAQSAFDLLPIKDTVTWNSLIGGYAEEGHNREVFHYFAQMVHNSVVPDTVTYICVLKACSNLRRVDKVCYVHNEITIRGLEQNITICNMLIDIYARFGCSREAKELFNQLSVKSTISWNAMIAGYVNHGSSEEALNCFWRMLHLSASPDDVTLIFCLKACADIGDEHHGYNIHSEILKRGFLENNELVGSTIVDMYAKCGLLEDAQMVFSKLPSNDMVCWTALLSGYAERGFNVEALYYFDDMQERSISPGAITYACSIKASGNLGVIDKGREIHAEIIAKGFLDKDVYLGSTLVDMYSKCGLLLEARVIFDKLSFRDVVSWIALMKGYIEIGNAEAVLSCLEQMQYEDTLPCHVTYLYSLKACGIIGDICYTKRLYTDIVSKGLDDEIVISHALVDVFAKCGFFFEATAVLHSIAHLDATSLNFLLSGFVKYGYYEKSFEYFYQFQNESCVFNCETYTYGFRACGILQAKDEGREIHEEVVKKGLEQDSAVCNSLISMYMNCYLLEEAQDVLDSFPHKDSDTWSTLIAGYADHGRHGTAVKYLKEMQSQGFYTSEQTLAISLKAFIAVGQIIEGKEMHILIVKKGLEQVAVIGNMLVSMYSKSGLLDEAIGVFYITNTTTKSAVSWNAIIGSFIDQGRFEEAIEWFDEMKCQGIYADITSTLHALKACGSLGSIVKGREIHAGVVKQGLEDLLIDNTLVDVYVKCGSIEEAEKVFYSLPIHDVISFTALITGYAQFGFIEQVLEILQKMFVQGEKQNSITFASVINACCHAGFIAEGEAYFVFVNDEFGWVPTLEHYTCMVDLHGRSGHTLRALTTIINMPFHPGIVAWHSLLGSCQRSCDVELGKHAFDNAMQLDENDIVAHLYMSNLYAETNRSYSHEMSLL